MDVTFNEKGKTKIAAYFLTYEEGQDPDIMKKIDADLTARVKKGYTVGIVSASSPRPPTWDELVESMRRLEGELEWWQMCQERKRRQEETKQKEKKEMSTSYYIFTEVKVDGAWHCINGKITRLMPIEHPIMAPTFHTDARRHFEKAFLQLNDDGHRFDLEDISENLRVAVVEWLNPEDSIKLAVSYDKILNMLNASGKEHCAFALRSEVADYENDDADDIYEYVSAKEYRQMDDELKKAYQYYEWNDRSGAYRYYEEIQKQVASQLRDWKEVNPQEVIEDIRIVLFTK